MKVRNGFVSNSSSSSFVCDVCGREESGMDLSLSECEMRECENNHTYCIEHESVSPGEVDADEMKKELLKTEWFMEDHEEEEVNEMEEEELQDCYSDAFGEDEYYEVSSKFCPCCQFEHATDKDLLSYFLVRQGLTRDAATEELKANYANFDELNKVVEKIK